MTDRELPYMPHWGNEVTFYFNDDYPVLKKYGIYELTISHYPSEEFASVKVIFRSPRETNIFSNSQFSVKVDLTPKGYKEIYEFRIGDTLVKLLSDAGQDAKHIVEKILNSLGIPKKGSVEIKNGWVV